MHTTHVVRGDEWVSSYPIHHQFFEVLGFKEPIYAHIAPINKKEGDTLRKLSKRKDTEAAISYYHELGIPVEVIRLYLATICNYDFEEWYTANPDKSIDDFTFELREDEPMESIPIDVIFSNCVITKLFYLCIFISIN